MGSTLSFDVNDAYAARLALYHDELDVYAENVDAYLKGSSAPTACLVPPVGLDGDPAEVARRGELFRADMTARGLWTPTFIDDVGSGP